MGPPGSFSGHFRSNHVWVSASDAGELAALTFKVLKAGKPPKTEAGAPGLANSKTDVADGFAAEALF
jgi:hypothetical protein